MDCELSNRKPRVAKGITAKTEPDGLAERFERMAKSIISIVFSALSLTACATVQIPGEPKGSPLYAAVQLPLAPDDNRIYLLAALPGRIVFRNDCVLFERLDRKLVLPIFEAGVIAGRDAHGGWLYDPVSQEFFRNGTKVYAGGGGSPDTVRQALRTLRLQRAIPARCREAVDDDAALILNPGLHQGNFDE